MIEVRRTAEFADWFRNLQDLRAAARIAVRIARAEAGNLGDVKYFDGIGEMRISYGPGYRVYFVQRGNELIILVCGGDKSTQAKDIKKAKALAKEI
jgi:putative addiction module killer protein